MIPVRVWRPAAYGRVIACLYAGVETGVDEIGAESGGATDEPDFFETDGDGRHAFAGFNRKGLFSAVEIEWLGEQSAIP